MLRLDEKVEGKPEGIRGCISKDHGLRGSRGKPDIHDGRENALGRGNVLVAGAEELVHPADAFRPVCKGGQRLDAADAIHFVGTANRVAGSHRPEVSGGVTTTVRGTPATCAGTAIMYVEEGKLPLPRGA